MKNITLFSTPLKFLVKLIDCIVIMSYHVFKKNLAQPVVLSYP